MNKQQPITIPPVSPRLRTRGPGGSAPWWEGLLRGGQSHPLKRLEKEKAILFSLLLCAVLFFPTILLAEDIIPDTILSSPAKTEEKKKEGPFTFHLFLEDEPQAFLKRSGLLVPLPDSEDINTANLSIPVPDSDFSSFLNRTSLDARGEWKIGSGLSLNFSNRINLFYDGYETEASNDLKELYIAGSLKGAYFLDLGRVNIKNGVALGYNPTDYFKAHAVSYRVSEDPSVLRENRLGTFMIRGQAIINAGTVTLAYAPPLEKESGKWWNFDHTSLLYVSRTNNESRFLASFNSNLFKDFNPEILYLNDNGRSSAGLNMTKAVGDSVVAYTEWSGTVSNDLLSQAKAATKATLLPGLQGDESNKVRNRLAAGFSYSYLDSSMANMEYHYNGAGMSKEQWQEWVNTGVNAKELRNDPLTKGLGRGMLEQLWSVRQWTLSAQDPLCRHYLFVRNYWHKAFFAKLDLTALGLVNLSDWSLFAQNTAEYHAGKSVTLNLTFELYTGYKGSEFGSLPQNAIIRGGARYYF